LQLSRAVKVTSFEYSDFNLSDPNSSHTHVLPVQSKYGVYIPLLFDNNADTLWSARASKDYPVKDSAIAKQKWYVKKNFTDHLIYFDGYKGDVSYTPKVDEDYYGVLINIPEECEKHTYIYNHIGDKKLSSKDDESAKHMKASKTFCVIVAPPNPVTKVYFWGKADSDDKITVYTQSGSKNFAVKKGEFDDKVKDGVDAAILVFKASSESMNRTVKFETDPKKDYGVDPTINVHDWYDLTKYAVKDDSLAVGIIVAIIFAILIFIGLVILFIWCCTCREDSGRSSADQNMETAIA